MRALYLVPFVLASLPGLGGAKPYVVKGDVGNSTMTAVFDAPFGERITALSSSVSCSLDIDAATGTAKGTCSIRLTSIQIDSEPTKTDHFYQWATNKKSDPMTCEVRVSIDGKATGPLKPKEPATFAFDGSFSVCGKAHEGGAKERIEGAAILMPAGEYGSKETIRVRAKVAEFDREKYHVGPNWTGGWLARVQALAPVVAKSGEININLFATAK